MKQNLPWTRIVLVLSLTLNFLVAGAAVGFFAGGWHKTPDFATQQSGPRGGDGKRAGRGMPPVLGPVLQQMERQDARRFLRSLRDLQQQQGLTRDAHADVQSAIAAALNAAPFDPDALTMALASLRMDQTQRAEITHRELVRIVSEMTDDQRGAIAETITTRITSRRR